MESTKVDIKYNNIKFGETILPSIHVLPNKVTIITITNKLDITNITHFRLTSSKALQNEDQIWYLSNINKQQIKTKIGLISMKIDVNFNKELILKGATLISFIASNFSVSKATNNKLYTYSDASFYSTTIFNVILPNNSILNLYINNTYIGYSPLKNNKLIPGLNIMNQIPMIIEKNINNIQIIENFLSSFIEGNNQMVELRGPVLYNTTKKTVIDNIVSIEVLATGSPQGNQLAFGGLVDRVSQDGWDVKGTKNHIRGAYANMLVCRIIVQ